MGRGGVGARQLLRRAELGVREAALARQGRVVGSRGGDDDARGGAEVRDQQVEERGVAEVVDHEGLLVAFFVGRHGAEELGAGVEDEGDDGRVVPRRPGCCKGAHFGERGEVEGEEGYVPLGELGVDFLRRRVGVAASGDDHQIVGVLLGDTKGCIVAQATGPTGEEHRVCVGHC